MFLGPHRFRLQKDKTNLITAGMLSVYPPPMCVVTTQTALTD